MQDKQSVCEPKFIKQTFQIAESQSWDSWHKMLLCAYLCNPHENSVLCKETDPRIKLNRPSMFNYKQSLSQTKYFKWYVRNTTNLQRLPSLSILQGTA